MSAGGDTGEERWTCATVPLGNETEARRATATWNGALIAESDETIVAERNHSFAPASVQSDRLRPSGHHTVCRGRVPRVTTTLAVGDPVNENAAWYSPQPNDAAAQIADYVAF